MIINFKLGWVDHTCYPSVCLPLYHTQIMCRIGQYHLDTFYFPSYTISMTLINKRLAFRSIDLYKAHVAIRPYLPQPSLLHDIRISRLGSTASCFRVVEAIPSAFVAAYIEYVFGITYPADFYPYPTCTDSCCNPFHHRSTFSVGTNIITPYIPSHHTFLNYKERGSGYNFI